MASRPENAIDFGCLQCQARLWTAPSEAGRRLRCPFCQFVQPVPTAKETAARAAKSGPESEYALHEGSEPQGPGPEYLTLTCPVCATRLIATPDQVGQTLKCPDCDTVVEVRAPARPVVSKRPIRPAGPGDEYPLWGVGQPPPDVKAVYQTYIPVVCPVCRTRMLGTEAEVGQKLTCPDCGTASIVPPPAPAFARKSVSAPAAADDAGYALREDAGLPGRDSADYETLFPVVCPLCQTRLHAAPEQVGQELICPDCQTPILVRAPAAAPPRIDPMAGAEAGYSIVPTAEMPAWQPVLTSVWAVDEADGESGTKEAGPPEERVSPRSTIRPTVAVPGSLWRGIAGFLLMPTIWPRWLLFSTGMLGVLLLMWIALLFSMIPLIPAWIFGLGFSGLAGMFAILWLVVFSANAIVIVIDTAAGLDSIEGWPEGPYQDWMPDAFYVVNAVVFGAIPGVALSWALNDFDRLPGPWPTVGLFLMFPIVLLSMLDWGSAVRPLSRSILASLLWKWWAWLLFYAAAAVLLISTVMLAALLVQGLGGWGAVLAVPIPVGGLLIYFRLLGRLGMVCSEQA